jgi:hypothetical protein
MFSLINTVLLKPISDANRAPPGGVYSRDITRADDYRLFSHPNYADRAQHQFG